MFEAVHLKLKFISGTTAIPRLAACWIWGAPPLTRLLKLFQEVPHGVSQEDLDQQSIHDVRNKCATRLEGNPSNS